MNNKVQQKLLHYLALRQTVFCRPVTNNGDARYLRKATKIISPESKFQFFFGQVLSFLKTVSVLGRYNEAYLVNLISGFIKFLAMMSKDELLEGLELLYTGKAFAGFQEENPFVTFLRFDKTSWTNIWVKYGGKTIFTSLKCVRLKSDRNLAI